MIVDTGILYALVDHRDPAHEIAKKIIVLRRPKIAPEPVITETAWMVDRRLGALAEAGFLAGLQQSSIAIECPRQRDRVRAAELVERYENVRLGYVDAVIVAIAERLREKQIATLNARDFSIVRPHHVAAFELLPAGQ